jgi:hypothetical protein
MNIEENKRMKTSEGEDGEDDDNDNSWSGMKP